MEETPHVGSVEEAVELVRSRVHSLAGDIAAIKLSTSVIEQRLLSVVERATDHEVRLREIERLPPNRVAADNEREHTGFKTKMERLEAEVEALKIRMAFWAGGGSVVGALLGVLIARLTGG